MTLCFYGQNTDTTTTPPTVTQRPVSCVRFVDYLDGNLKSFSIQSKTVVSGPHGWGKLTLSNVAMPKTDQALNQTLKVDGLIYLDDIWVLDDRTADVSQGGYLGTRELQFAVTKRDWTENPDLTPGPYVEETEFVSVPVLGAYHATYQGGLRLSNLTSDFISMRVDNWGNTLHPSVQQPDGGTVGDYVTPVGNSHLFAFNKNGRNWTHDIQTINFGWTQFAEGNRNTNMTVRHDGEYTAGVVCDLRVQGVLGSGRPSSCVSFELNQHGGLVA